MAFGQVSGPPASAKQVEQLRALFEGAGYADFREARHPFSLTQRQAGGKFTRDEADELIERLVAERDNAGDVPDAGEPEPARVVVAMPRPTAAAKPKPKSTADALRRVPAELLAAELQRRGWIVVEP